MSFGQIEITAGGARRDRTDDLLLAKQALSQLSYGPALAVTPAPATGMVGLGRLELPTSRLSSARSNQLSYRPNLQARTHDPRANHPRFAGKRMLHRPWVTAWARPRRKRNEDGGVPLCISKRNGCASRNSQTFRIVQVRARIPP